jgi:putative addiction module antidote
MFSLRLRKIGTSLGIILPKEMLLHLRVRDGQEVFAIETPSGYLLTSLGPEIRKQVEAGETLMNCYSDVFSALAK